MFYGIGSSLLKLKGKKCVEVSFMKSSLTQKYPSSNGVHVVQVWQLQITSQVLQSKFFSTYKKRAFNAVDDLCLVYKRDQKKTILATNFPLWRLILVTKYLLIQGSSEVHNSLFQGNFTRCRISFLLTRENFIAKSSLGSHSFLSRFRIFSNLIFSNPMMNSNWKILSSTFLFFEIVHYYARFRLIFLKLDTDFLAYSDYFYDFDHKNSHISMYLTWRMHVENAISTYSFSTVATENFRCRQKISLSAASSCVVYKRAVRRCTVRSPLALVKHGGNYSG